jgi:hypothetical protein
VKRLLIGVVVGALVGASGGTASQPERRSTPRQAAKALAADYLAALVRPDTKTVTVRASRCQSAGRWHVCRVIVTGQTTCRALVRVLQPVGSEYEGWIPRMRCR